MATNSGGAFRRGLVEAANLWVNAAKMEEMARKDADIAAGFAIGSVVVGETSAYIEITNSAPEMPAFEFGSGLYGRKGAKYPIRAKDAPMLAFWWIAGPNSTKQNKKTEFVKFLEVQHPGVHPNPIMKPALEKKRAEMLRAIGSAFTTEVVYKTIREAFKNA